MGGRCSFSFLLGAVVMRGRAGRGHESLLVDAVLDMHEQ